MTQIPTLQTDRLILRAPSADDFEAFATYMASDRSRYNGGPGNRSVAWKGLAMVIGHWTLRGYGLWSAFEKTTGDLVGRFGFWHPEGGLGCEIAWMVYDGFEGNGYAFEASAFLLEYADSQLGWPSMISVIAPENDRSIALAKRLGGHWERDWVSPEGKPSVVYRHAASDTDGGMEAYS